MFRSGLLGGMLAAFITPASIYLNNAISHSPQASVTQEVNDSLSRSLSAFSETLVSFESRQTGSERELSEQLKLLASSVAETQKASQSQIDALAKSIDAVRSVATKPDDTSEFKQLLKNFGTNLERRIDQNVKTFVAAQVDPEGVGTLDVDNKPSDTTDVGSIQTIPDAARRIIALEKEVKALKSRSVTSTSSAPVSTYYSTPTYAAGGGCTGSYQTVQSSPSYSYTAQPSYSYSQPSYSYAQPQRYSQPRWFSGSRSSGTCRIVNGVQICN